MHIDEGGQEKKARDMDLSGGGGVIFVLRGGVRGYTAGTPHRVANIPRLFDFLGT